ncbi:MAG TPA: hypothetical protein VK604_22170 [Bryobacteraceae bacterium]|nr:hypothetical protein [Bryobacteraceae bacterium]
MSDLRLEYPRVDGRQHLPDADLLLYLDGEMPPKDATICRTHLEYCWRCQARQAALRNAIHSFVGFLEDDYSPQLPMPPNQWRGFDRKLRQLQAARLRPSWVLQASQGLMQWRAMLAGSGVAAATVAALFLFVGRPQKLSATELLRRVMSAEVSTQTGKPRRALRVTFGKKVFRAQAGLLPDQIARVLQSNHFDVQDPISAASFAAWRNSLNQKEDIVAESGGLLTLRTKPRQEAGEWQILEASLTVRTQDFYPVRESFTIGSAQGPETVEFTESEDSAPLVPPAATLAASRLERAVPTGITPSARTLREVAAPEAPPALELHVVSRIHAIGADLGQEAAVSRTEGNALAVNAVVEHLERKRQILAALAPFEQNPAIHFNILTTAEAAGQNRRSPGRIRRTLLVDGSPSGNTVRAGPALLSYFSSRGVPEPELTGKIQRFSEEAVRHSKAALLHSLALQDFVTRFSLSDMHSFQEADRSQWRQVICDHAQSIADNTAALRAQLTPVYGIAAGYGEKGATVKPNGLRPMSASLVALVKSQDEIVHSAFTLSNEEASAPAINAPLFWRSLSEVQDSARQIRYLSLP